MPTLIQIEPLNLMGIRIQKQSVFTYNWLVKKVKFQTCELR